MELLNPYKFNIDSLFFIVTIGAIAVTMCFERTKHIAILIGFVGTLFLLLTLVAHIDYARHYTERCGGMCIGQGRVQQWGCGCFDGQSFLPVQEWPFRTQIGGFLNEFRWFEADLIINLITMAMLMGGSFLAGALYGNKLK